MWNASILIRVLFLYIYCVSLNFQLTCMKHKYVCESLWGKHYHERVHMRSKHPNISSLLNKGNLSLWFHVSVHFSIVFGTRKALEDDSYVFHRYSVFTTPRWNICINKVPCSKLNKWGHGWKLTGSESQRRSDVFCDETCFKPSRFSCQAMHNNVPILTVVNIDSNLCWCLFTVRWLKNNSSRSWKQHSEFVSGGCHCYIYDKSKSGESGKILRKLL